MSFIDKFFDVKENQQVLGLTSELKAIYIKKIFEKEKSIIYVTNSLYDANNIYQCLSNYTDDVLFFPMDDFLTSKALTISPEFKTTRLETIEEIIKNDHKIVVTNLMGYLRYLPSKEKFSKTIINLKINQEYDNEKLKNDLFDMGYSNEILVYKTGEFATRGFVIDIFPIGEINPIRIEFFGNELESIRVFDTETQKTIKNIDSISIKTNTEYTLNDSKFDNKTISDYLPNVITVFDNFNNIKIGYEQLEIEIHDYNVLKQINEEQMNDLYSIKTKKCIYFNNYDNFINNNYELIKIESYDIDKLPSRLEDISKILNKYIIQKKTVILCLNNRYQINKIIDAIENNNFIVTNEDEIFENKINLIIKNINYGYVYKNYAVFGEREIFNKSNLNIKYKSNFKYGTKIKDITKLNIGDYVVHSVHGIGKYLGLKTLKKNCYDKDYLMIEYRNGDKLYIPVEKIDFITKYSSADGKIPSINKLGSSEWAKTKIRVRKKLENIASDLIKLYAKREASQGYQFIEDDKEQFEFEKKFQYEDTIDQHKSSEEIKRDMESSRPMDRLLCGDVGYGKTEVAFRAIFKAISSGKQVAYLCPTTILSNQQYQNALKRFEDYPINIELLNRFISAKKTNQIIQRIKDGKVDIVIGTHILFNDKIEYKNLGLLIIDEEQRFGVKHKEKIKNYKENIDVLTLSATPIPRTLQMSLTGVRNLSLIETPPLNRYPVQTYVLGENSMIIKDAIYKELSREGQIFVLYNNVSSMEQKKQELQILVPDARVICAHGQMTKIELEEVMIKFINKEYDILLCTTIIETGIDMPNVNTLIILDADRFGLSQLYQIRGRVGRSNRIAYCYLMYNPGKILSDVANKRLNAIKEFTELGSGYNIAMRDLAIRGAGDILGSEQAGFIDTVGIELYLTMLNEEIDKLKGIYKEKSVESEQPLINVETTIKDNYVSDVDLKIEIHKKINSIDSYEKLCEVKEELEDRFGRISEKMLIYMYEEWFEKVAKELNISRIKQTSSSIEIILEKELTDKVNGDLLFIMVSDITRNFRFSMFGKCLMITLALNKIDKHFIFYLIELMEILKKATS